MKIILKIFLIIFVFLINYNLSNANECKIEAGPSNGLNNYVKNTEKILNNISGQLTGGDSGINNYSTKIFNDIFNFSNYNDNQRFYSFHRRFQEVPKEIERDYNRLKTLDNKLKNIINKIGDLNISEKKSQNVCSGVINCGFSNNDNLGDIVRNIAQNQERVKSIYLKISESETNFREDICKNGVLKVQGCIFLVEDNFINDLKNNYSPENSLVCSEKNGFLKDIKEKTGNIFINNKSAKDGIKKWKEAWALVTGINTLPKEQREQIEKELLKKELSRQGVSGDRQKNILESLDKFNKQGSFSFNNNFIVNSFEQSRKKFQNEFQRIREEVSADFIENYNKKTRDNLPINTLNQAKSNSDRIKFVEQRIREMYNQNVEYLAIGELSGDNLRTRLINTHIEISNSIKTLEKTCKLAVKICNQQDSGSGNCGDCNW